MATSEHPVSASFEPEVDTVCRVWFITNMRSSGAPVLFGACLASASIQQCSCFMRSPHLITTRTGRVVSARNSPGLRGRSSTTATFSAKLTDSDYHVVQNGRRAAPSVGGAASDDDDHYSNYARLRRHQRRTRLASTKDRAGSPSSSSITRAVSSSTTTRSEKLLAAEIAARKLDAGKHDLTSLEIEHDIRVSTDSSAMLERQRQVEMSALPPPELMTEHKSIGHLNGAPNVGTNLAFAENLQRSSDVDSDTGGGGGDQTSLWASRAMLAGAAALYGTNFGCVKLLEESVPMSLAAVLRFSVAVIPFIPFFVKMKPGVFRAGAEIGAYNAVGYWAQSQALMTTSASKAAFICSLAVVLVPMLDVIFGANADRGEVATAGPKIAPEKANAGGVLASLNGPWFPALLAAAGVACLELVGVEGGPNQGDLWALIQPISFGLGFWRTERLSRMYPTDTFGIVAAQVLTVAAMAAAWCVSSGDVPVSLEALKQVVLPASGSLLIPISLLWTGLATTSLTVYGETLAMKQISATESTVILSTEPIWGTAFAALLLGETIGWNTGLGALLILSACTWTSVGPAIQSYLLSTIAATGAVGAVGEAELGPDIDDVARATVEFFKGLFE